MDHGAGSAEAAGEVDGVPDISVDGYRAITGFAHSAPGWLQASLEVATSAVVLLLGLLMVVNLWRVRGSGRRALALGVAAPAVTALAYGISEALKSVLEQGRPCRAVPNALPSLVDCPAVGDWSLPSNHSTIAAAAAVALAIAWRSAAVPALLLAVLEGFTRVSLGVHYPHDVLAGFLLGGVVAALGALLVAKLAADRSASPVRTPAG
ncbi:phosphatase PAP2 family protein [Salinifilum ghardaiensis]